MFAERPWAGRRLCDISMYTHTRRVSGSVLTVRQSAVVRPEALDPDPVWPAWQEAVVALHTSCKLMFFVDLHAHATKRGCFCYANALPTFQEQMDNMLYARLISINSPHYDFNACVFSEKAMKSEDKNGQSKEGSSRVGIYRWSTTSPRLALACLSATSPIAPGDAIRELPHRVWGCRKMEV